jgi:condensin complex subunit 1
MDLLRLCIGRLRDKSSNVRKNAIKFLTLAVDTHPFAMDERTLSKHVFLKKKREIELTLRKLIPTNGVSENDVNDDGINDAADAGAPDAINNLHNHRTDSAVTSEEQQAIEMTVGATNDTAAKLQLIHRYYEDALSFVELIESAVPVVCNLLASTAKLEVVEAMEFFRIMKFYDMAAADVSGCWHVLLSLG